jgi:hypothetical protein
MAADKKGIINGIVTKRESAVVDLIGGCGSGAEAPEIRHVGGLNQWVFRKSRSERYPDTNNKEQA